LEEDSQEGLKEVPASEILDKIRKGEPVVYIRRIVKEDIAIGNLNLLKDADERFIVNSRISIIDSQIDGSIYFSDAAFKESVSFSGSKLSMGASFHNSHFHKDANFIGSRFCKATTFTSAIFKSDARFFCAKFYGPAYFGGKNLFRGVADFNGSKFSMLAYFIGSYFCSDASFNESTFDKKADFGYSVFNKRLLLDDSSIYSMNLCAEFDKDSTVSIKRSDFFRIYVPWISIKDKFEYDGSAYLALIRNYNYLEWFDDADKCHYHYRSIRRKKHLHGLGWAIDIIPWLFYGYGVRFYYPLSWMIGVLVFSAIIYMLGGQAEFPGAFGLSTVILTTTTQVYGLNGPLTGTCWIMSIIERMAGWLLMSTFLVALAKKTLR
jgi:hypothetical protein